MVEEVEGMGIEEGIMECRIRIGEERRRIVGIYVNKDVHKRK